MATDPACQPDLLDSLPTELKCTVAHNVTGLEDRKALSLTNKIWATVVMPIMWETLCSDLMETGKRQVLSLAHPQSNIIKHVRYLEMNNDFLDEEDGHHLRMVLATIPPGQLRGFTCRRIVPTPILQLLLRLHPECKHFQISTAEILNLLKCPWTPETFRLPKSLHMNIEFMIKEDVQFMWAWCTGVRHVELSTPLYRSKPRRVLNDEYYMPYQKTAVDDPAVVYRPESKLELRGLCLKRIRFPRVFNNMFQRIDVFLLRKLTINAGIGVDNLLTALAREFATGHPTLEDLQIIEQASQTGTKLMKSLCHLLLSFRGLEILFFQSSDSGRMDVAGICHHGGTLKELIFINGSPDRKIKSKCMQSADVQKIATACPQLEQFFLNLYELDPGRPESDVLGSTGTAFEASLDAIAAMKSLRILVLTNPPDYFKAGGPDFQRQLKSGEHRYAFQARANGVMRHLGNRHSNLKFLAFMTQDLKKAHSADKNGHFWPNYFYARGTVVDFCQVTYAVATPVQYSDMRL